MGRKRRSLDVPLALVSLILGMSVWLYAKSLKAQLETRRIDVELRVSAKSEDVEITNKPKYVWAEVTGSPEELDKLRWDNLGAYAFVDLSNATARVDLYDVRFEVPPSLRHLRWQSQQTVEIATEELVTLMRPVQVETSGDSPTGLNLGSATVEPETVEIRGAKSAVEKVEFIKAQLDLATAQTGKSRRLQVLLLDAKNSLVRNVRAIPNSVTVTPVLTAAEPKRNLLVNPVWTGQPKWGFRVSGIEVLPSQVAVQGARSALEDLLVVDTEPIDLTGLNATTRRTVRLRLPAGVRALSARRVDVTIRIEPLRDSAIPPNAPPGAGS